MKYLLIFLSCFIVFVANAEPPTKDVNVVNTPTVNAQQSGDWNVNINGLTGVTIENGPLEPVPVEITNQSNGDGELINILIAGAFQSGSVDLTESASINAPKLYQVPTGKKFILRHVACTVQISLGSEFSLEFVQNVTNTTSQNAAEGAFDSTYYPLIANKAYSTSTWDYYSINQAMLVVVGGPTSNGYLILHGYKVSGSGSGLVRCGLTGEIKNL